MPAMSGTELVRRAVALRPGLRILLMTSYTADMLREMNLMPRGVHMIIKPFRAHALVQRVELILKA